MPVTAVISPDFSIAGGVNVGGKIVTIGHNFLTGNAAGKRAKLATALQEYLDHRGDGYIPWNTLPVDDPDRRDHVDFNHPIVTDHLGLVDDGSSVRVTVTHREFIFDDGNPNKEYAVSRTIVCGITLSVPNDPTLGGEDRYSLTFRRTV